MDNLSRLETAPISIFRIAQNIQDDIRNLNAEKLDPVSYESIETVRERINEVFKRSQDRRREITAKYEAAIIELETKCWAEIAEVNQEATEELCDLRDLERKLTKYAV